MNDKKNIVFMMNIDLKKDDGSRFSSSRIKPYQYSIDSWTKWANKNNCEMFLLTELLTPHEEMGLCWQRYYIFDLLKNSDINYDQVLLVDADTIVHPDCPNFFEMTERKFTGAKFDASFEWILRSIELYGKFVFPSLRFKYWEYIDTGFFIVNESHQEMFSGLVDLYWENKDAFKKLEEAKLGTDQTPLNLYRAITNVPIKLLPYEFNMVDLSRKNVLTDDMTYTKMGYIYQFNCIPNNTNNELTFHWMKKTYEHLYA